MRPNQSSSYLKRLKLLCLGRTEAIAPWLEERSWKWPLFCCLVILLGSGVYGLSVGFWRSPLQSLYTGIKIPLLIFLTCGGNALLNGMLGQLLGTGLSFRKTAMLILYSFTIASLILASFSFIAFFIIYCIPTYVSSTEELLASGTSLAQMIQGHSITLLTHVFLVAYAGIMANYRLLQLLRHLTPKKQTANAALIAWLAGNLLLGAQLSWILRPFFGSPGLEVQFLRIDPLRGNFFEAVWKAIQNLFF